MNGKGSAHGMENSKECNTRQEKFACNQIIVSLVLHSLKELQVNQDN